MTLRIVLIGLGLSRTCQDLADALRRRRHDVTYFRYFGGHADTGPTLCYHSTESLFRRHTGTLRWADLIVVSSDVPNRTAVTNWILDQACGVVAYCDVEPGRRSSNRPPPAFDLYVSCSAGHDPDQRATALEQFVFGIAVPAP